MLEALRLAVRLTLFPNIEMTRIGKVPECQRRTLVRFLLPLACIPTFSWSLGLLVNREDISLSLASIAHRGAVVYFGSLLSIYLLAAALFVLSPLFAVPRAWRPAFQLAAYSSAPVMLSGFLLVLPVLAFATLLAVCHSFYLLYVGASSVQRVKEGDAAEYVALVTVLLVVSSTFLGAFGSWVGIL